MPKIWEIWLEGYSASGEQAPPRRVGFESGKTFRKAVLALIPKTSYNDPNFDPEHLTYWGLKFYTIDKKGRRS